MWAESKWASLSLFLSVTDTYTHTYTYTCAARQQCVFVLFPTKRINCNSLDWVVCSGKVVLEALKSTLSQALSGIWLVSTQLVTRFDKVMTNSHSCTRLAKNLTAVHTLAAMHLRTLTWESCKFSKTTNALTFGDCYSHITEPLPVKLYFDEKVERGLKYGAGRFKLVINNPIFPILFL